MSKEQLKEEAKRELKRYFHLGIFEKGKGNLYINGDTRSLSNIYYDECSAKILNFINSLIDKAYKEREKEGSKGAKFNLEQKGKEDMNYELIEEKYFN